MGVFIISSYLYEVFQISVFLSEVSISPSPRRELRNSKKSKNDFTNFLHSHRSLLLNFRRLKYCHIVAKLVCSSYLHFNSSDVNNFGFKSHIK